MKINNAEIENLYKSFISQRRKRTLSRCPPLRHLLSIFDTTISGKTKLRLVDHITTCPDCYRSFRLILDLRRRQESMPKSPHQVISGRKSSHSVIASRRKYSIMAQYSQIIAGTIFVLISLIVVFQGWHPDQKTRASPRTVYLDQPVGEHTSSSPLIFKWDKLPGADSYVLELFNDTLILIWTSPRLTSTQVSPPDYVCHMLLDNKNYFWMITAFRNDTKWGESKLTPLRILPK